MIDLHSDVLRRLNGALTVIFFTLADVAAICSLKLDFRLFFLDYSYVFRVRYLVHLLACAISHVAKLKSRQSLADG